MATSPRLMKAIRLVTPGPPSSLKLADIPIPVPKNGEVLIRVKAFGLNYAETRSRKTGVAPIGPVQLPKTPGAEAVGIVEAAPGAESEYPVGSTVMAAMGGMGVNMDGGYAQYACVPTRIVQVLKHPTKLGWEVLGALPAMLQTAHGGLYRSLKIQKGETLLIRGGTTSVGLAAAAIARNAGLTVIATTRKTDEKTTQMLRDNGAAHVLVEDGSSVGGKVKELYPSGVNKILELVGGLTLPDSLSCLAKEGICCLIGLVGGTPTVKDFNPMALLPIGRYLTSYGEFTFTPDNLPLDELVQQVEQGVLKIPMGKVFQMDQIVEAHELMESSQAGGKLVVLTGM